MSSLDARPAAALFLCCWLVGCGNPGTRKDEATNGAPSVAPPSQANAHARAIPAVAGNATSPPAAEAEASTGGRELADGSANLDFIAVNHTGQTITALSISPEGEESWTPDILVPRDVPSGERGAASFSRDVEICSWDVRATYEGGHRQSWP